MTQQPPAHDETVRLPADGGNGRPSLEGRRPSAAAAQEARPVPGERPDDAGWPDDTRPVTRDWLLGAPAEAPVPPEAPAEEPGEPTAEATPAVDVAASEPPAEAGPDWVTEQIDPVRSEPAAPSTGMTPVPATAADETAGIDGLPYSVDAGGPGAPQNPTGGQPPFGSPGPRWPRPAVLVPLLLLVVLGAGYGVDLVVTSGDVARSTVVAGVDIGGLSPAAAADTLERDLAPRLAADRKVTADDVDATLSPPAAGITLDVDATVDRADDQPLNPWTRLVTLFSDRQVEPVLAVDETALDAQLEALAEQVDRAPVDATIAFDGTTPRLVEPADGRALDRADSADALTGALVSGADPATPVDLPVRISRVHVDAATAQQVLDETVTPALSAPVEVTSDDGGITAEVPVAAIAASLTFTPQESGDLQVGIDPAALQTALGDQLRAFGTPAQDARFEVSGGKVSVVASVDGTGVDPAQLAKQLLPVLTAPEPRSVTAALGPVPAELTTQEAEALGIREEISTFTTHYTAAASGTNMRTAAKKIDGTVVLPGETFSLNEATGPRGLAQGYVEAGVISGGDFTTSVGGGVSQLATTIFNAVFFAGLEDVHHKPHSYYISRYPPGREATVWYDSLDLKWRNDSDTGVLVDTAWEPGSLTVTFYGTKRYEIESLTSERYDLTAPAVQEKADDDASCHAAAGSSGFSVTVTRVFRDLQTGAEIKREDFRTRYAAQPTVRCVAAGPPAPSEPAGATPAAD
jgi:vancomycin resistance protein YoaR